MNDIGRIVAFAGGGVTGRLHGCPLSSVRPRGEKLLASPSPLRVGGHQGTGSMSIASFYEKHLTRTRACLWSLLYRACVRSRVTNYVATAALAIVLAHVRPPLPTRIARTRRRPRTPRVRAARPIWPARGPSMRMCDMCALHCAHDPRARSVSHSGDKIECGLTAPTHYVMGIQMRLRARALGCILMW